MTIKRTTDRLPHVRYGGRNGVEFPPGVRVVDEYDLETEQWAVDTYDDVEFVDEVSTATDYVEREEDRNDGE